MNQRGTPHNDPNAPPPPPPAAAPVRPTLAAGPVLVAQRPPPRADRAPVRQHFLHASASAAHAVEAAVSSEDNLLSHSVFSSPDMSPAASRERRGGSIEFPFRAAQRPPRLRAAGLGDATAHDRRRNRFARVSLWERRQLEREERARTEDDVTRDDAGDADDAKDEQQLVSPLSAPPQHARMRQRPPPLRASLPKFDGTRSAPASAAAAAAARAHPFEELCLVSLVGEGAFGKVFMARRLGHVPGSRRRMRLRSDEDEQHEMAGDAQLLPPPAPPVEDSEAAEAAGSNVLAVKIVRKTRLRSRAMREQAESELRVLRACSSHPFVATLQFAYQTRRKLYIGLEFCSGGELFTYMSRHVLTAQQAALVALETAMALQHLHAHCVVFRDLKPENIAICHHGHVRLVDFGLSVFLESAEAWEGEGVHDADGGEQRSRRDVVQVVTACGTLAYSAPEILRRCPHAYESDWWSLGVILYELLTGAPPYGDAEGDAQRLCDSICTEDFEPLDPVVPGSLAYDLVSRLLVREPTARLGYLRADAERIVGHPLFAEFDKRALLRLAEGHGLPVAGGGRLDDVSSFDDAFTSAAPVDGSDSEEEQREERDAADMSIAGYELVADRTIRTAFLH